MSEKNFSFRVCLCERGGIIYCFATFCSCSLCKWQLLRKTFLVGEISVLVLGRCHFMNPSLHFICVTCRKRTGWLARLIFYAAKYNLVSIRHIWRIFFFRRTCIRENAISCRVHYSKKWPVGTHCSDKNTERKFRLWCQVSQLSNCSESSILFRRRRREKRGRLEENEGRCD